MVLIAMLITAQGTILTAYELSTILHESIGIVTTLNIPQMLIEIPIQMQNLMF